MSPSVLIPMTFPQRLGTSRMRRLESRDSTRVSLVTGSCFTLAAAKLTEFLQPAARELVGVDAQEMGRLFQRVRELLAAKKKELILLIEDFTVLQAIQRELLDALLIPAKQEGRETFCPLRAVLAVTTGYFRDLNFDTVGTRLRYVLDLDVPLDDIDASSRMDFVGRYLNAARLGEGRARLRG